MKRLKQLLEYDPITGYFTWIKRSSPSASRAVVGIRAGTCSGYYRKLAVDGVIYPEHYLAWLYMEGKFPPQEVEIDHIDRNKSNNSWSNLRLATSSQNAANTGKVKRNKSGYAGVYLAKYIKKGKTYNYWAAAIWKNRKQIYFELFNSKEEAAKARDRKMIDLFGEFAYTNFPKEDL